MEYSTFAAWLYNRLISDSHIDEEDYDEDELKTAEDVLEQVEDVDSDNIATYASMYVLACEENNETPDFEGFEEYAC